MTLQLNLILVLNAAQILPSPNISHLEPLTLDIALVSVSFTLMSIIALVPVITVASVIPTPSTPASTTLMLILTTLQLRNLAPHRCPRLFLVLRVEHQHQGPLERGRRPGPVLCWVGGVERVVFVVAPFVGIRWPADDGVLVEGEEVFVFEDGEVVGVDFVELFRYLVSVIVLGGLILEKGIKHGIKHGTRKKRRKKRAMEAYASPNNQRRLHRRPQSKMRSVLLECQIAISDLQHVWVGVAPEVGVFHVEGVFVGDFDDSGPGICALVALAFLSS